MECSRSCVLYQRKLWTSEVSDGRIWSDSESEGTYWQCYGKWTRQMGAVWGRPTRTDKALRNPAAALRDL